MEASAAKKDACADSLLARDGARSMRAVARRLAAKGDRLWKKDNQALRYPRKVHIAHITPYAVRPDEASLRHARDVRALTFQ